MAVKVRLGTRIHFLGGPGMDVLAGNRSEIIFAGNRGEEVCTAGRDGEAD